VSHPPEKLAPALPNRPDTPVLGATGVNFSGIPSITARGLN
jgi:hypothetical protein